MSRWPGCGGAAESRRGEVAPVLRDMEQKNVIHTLNQSVSYSLIVGSVHMGHKGGVKKHPSRGGFLIFLCFKFLSMNWVVIDTVIQPSSGISGFAPIFPDICYHLTHYKPAAADIPVASDNPAHYADAIRYNARTPLQGSLLPLTRLVWA